jgi:CYTH domain-containing protein
MSSGESVELELTYLARKIPDEISNIKPIKMLDIYIPGTDAKHSHLRLRQRGDRYEVTKKSPIAVNDASKQLEVTIPLDKVEFEALASSSGLRIVKDRYQVKINGFDAEVDVFKDNLKGLVLIDFEFQSEEDKDSFVQPAIALADVTQESFKAGGMLAGKSYTDIEKELHRFNYKKL